MAKKLLSLALVLCMVLSFSVAAFAAISDTTPNNGNGFDDTGKNSETVDDEDELIVNFTKYYINTDTGAASDPENHLAAKAPNETLKFTISPDTSVEGRSTSTVMPYIGVNGNNNDVENETGVYTVDVTNTKTKLYIHIPEYGKPGAYYYNITESVETASAGVTYSQDTFKLCVLVSYDGSDLKKTVYIVKQGTNEKIEYFTNVYSLTPGDPNGPTGNGDHGLTISKAIKGNQISTNQEFVIKVTFHSSSPVMSDIVYSQGTIKKWSETKETDWTKDGSTYTATVYLKLKGDASANFDYIPTNVTWDMEEVDCDEALKTQLESNSTYNVSDYTVRYTTNTLSKVDEDKVVDTFDVTTYGSDTALTGKTLSPTTTSTGTVLNYKNTTVATGISLDTIPYIALLLIATAGLAVVLTRKRRNED